MTVTICKSDDTDFNDLNLLKIKIATELDFTGFAAKFVLGDIVKTFDDISSKEFIVNFTKEDTSKLSYGNMDARLIVIDNQKREKCFVANIDFHITNTPPSTVAQELDINVYLTDTTYEFTTEIVTSPSKVSDLVNDENYQTLNQVNALIDVETLARQEADAELRQLIENVKPEACVRDIVNNYVGLINYSTAKLLDNDIIGVLADNTHDNSATYYRWVITGDMGSWEYLGTLGYFYTKTETDNKFVAKNDLKNKGDVTTPIYFDTDGKAQEITSYSGNAATATSATNDGNGNEITTTYVNLAGAQTITGAKTFTQSVTAPTFVGDLTGNATTATSATSATKDGNGDTITSTYVNLAGNQTITGAKIFSSAVTAFSFIGDLTGNATTATSATTAASADTATTLTGLTASVTELNYVDGVTSDVQTQIDNKFAKTDIQTSFGTPLSDVKVASEKLTKDTVDALADKFQTVSALPANPDITTYYFIPE